MPGNVKYLLLYYLTHSVLCLSLIHGAPKIILILTFLVFFSYNYSLQSVLQVTFDKKLAARHS